MKHKNKSKINFYFITEDELEENSIRSLFKISEESLAQLNTNSNNQANTNIYHQANSKYKIESKNHKTKQSKKKRNITKPNVASAPAAATYNTSIEPLPSIGSVHTLKQSYSVPGMDLKQIKETTSMQMQSSSSMSSLNLMDKLHRNPNQDSATNTLIYNGAKSDNKLTSGVQFAQIRRAQSDITFDLFEKLLKKHRLQKLVNKADSDAEEGCLIRHDDFLNQVEEQYYEEVDNEVKKNSNKSNQVRISHTFLFI